MLENLSWSEIEARYSGEWIELVHCDWPEGLPNPSSGIVRAHSRDRNEFFALLKSAPIDNATVIFVGRPTRLGDLGLSSSGLGSLCGEMSFTEAP